MHDGSAQVRPRPPALSVIIGTPDNSARSIRLVLQSLAQQAVREQIEAIIVTESRAALNLDDADGQRLLGDGSGVRVVEIGPFSAWSRAMVAGLREAAAPIVLLAEDHAFWAPDAIAHFIDAHARFPDAAGIGPAMNNANPRTGLSWAHLISAYGRWLDGRTSDGPIDDIPGHNASYKASVLLSIPTDKLERLLDRGGSIHKALREMGCKLYMEPRARCFHLNASKLSDSVRLRFFSGRVFGGNRSREWGFGKRAVYVICSPLLPIMRMRYAVVNLRRSHRLAETIFSPRRLVALLSMMCVGVVGEVYGYVVRVNASTDIARRDEFEFHRYRQLCDSDLRAGFEIDGATIRPTSDSAARALTVGA